MEGHKISGVMDGHTKEEWALVFFFFLFFFFGL
jgi:hypothetical protein